MKYIKGIMLLGIMISIFGINTGSVVATGPTFGEISVSPAAPAPLSTITLSTVLSGEIPSEVRATVEECNGRTGICYPDIQNISMSLIGQGNYRANVTLKHADATYITCHIVAKTNGVWTSSAKKNINLSEQTNGNSNGTNGNDGNIIPGFEVVLIIIAIAVGLIVVRRKRVS